MHLDDYSFNLDNGTFTDAVKALAESRLAEALASGRAVATIDLPAGWLDHRPKRQLWTAPCGTQVYPGYCRKIGDIYWKLAVARVDRDHATFDSGRPVRIDAIPMFPGTGEGETAELAFETVGAIPIIDAHELVRLFPGDPSVLQELDVTLGDQSTEVRAERFYCLASEAEALRRRFAVALGLASEGLG